ncbi:hypothetical protein [Streptomyces sp. WAC05374]|uniref:hypothetical protein n=1 Tax=Streptomyces sp. WAC05374 TaxID=2487420 RepID=UPI001F396025|nr:hypothetical protein [Streptomyces sp. WAC05374]
MDFEPGAEGIALHPAADLVIQGWGPASGIRQSDKTAFQHALGTGVREELSALGPETPLAVAVVLRSMRVHELDSHVEAFRTAGRIAVKNALSLAYRPS